MMVLPVSDWMPHTITISRQHDKAAAVTDYKLLQAALNASFCAPAD